MRTTFGLAGDKDGYQSKGVFVILVGPGGRSQAGLALTLRSLEVNVLAFNPRPVILFYGAGSEASAGLRHRTEAPCDAACDWMFCNPRAL